MELIQGGEAVFTDDLLQRAKLKGACDELPEVGTRAQDIPIGDLWWAESVHLLTDQERSTVSKTVVASAPVEVLIGELPEWAWAFGYGHGYGYGYGDSDGDGYGYGYGDGDGYGFVREAGDGYGDSDGDGGV